MNWASIHWFAQELELWMSLVINTWIFAAGGVFVVSRLRHIKLSIRDVGLIALRLQVILVGLIVAAYFFGLAIYTQVEGVVRVGDAIFGVCGAVLAIYAVFHWNELD